VRQLPQSDKGSALANPGRLVLSQNAYAAQRIGDGECNQLASNQTISRAFRRGTLSVEHAAFAAVGTKLKGLCLQSSISGALLIARKRVCAAIF